VQSVLAASALASQVAGGTSVPPALLEGLAVTLNALAIGQVAVLTVLPCCGAARGRAVDAARVATNDADDDAGAAESLLIVNSAPQAVNPLPTDKVERL